MMVNKNERGEHHPPGGKGEEVAMAATCEAHQFMTATGTCKDCRYDFCPECLVYPHGEDKAPYCVPCALAMSGIRSTAGRSRNEERHREPVGAAGNVMVKVAAGVALVAGSGLVGAATLL